MNRIAIGVLLVLSTLGCITTVNPVTFKRDTGARTYDERPEGCAVEIFDENDKPPRPYLVFGRIELSWSQNQVKEQGAEYAMKTLRTATCEYGGHYLVNMRALPRGFKEGMLYEAEIAVMLDDKGEPIRGQATGTAASSEFVTGTSSAVDTTPKPSSSSSPSVP